jgi:hypothetical protein
MLSLTFYDVLKSGVLFLACPEFTWKLDEGDARPADLF